MKDIDIVREIKKGNHEKSLRFLYEEFPKIKAYILASGGNKEIAQEIFNDSLLLMLEKIEREDFQLTSKLTSFLYGIARFMWMNEMRRKNKKIDNLEWSDTLIITNEDLDYDYEKEKKLLALDQILNSVSENCKKIFQLFYFQKESMKTIAERLNFSSVNSAKVQKFKCLEKAIQLSQKINH